MSYDGWKLATPPEYSEPDDRPLDRYSFATPRRPAWAGLSDRFGLDDFDWATTAGKPAAPPPEPDDDIDF